MKPRLSFVLFSALLSHGGGRETWLNNILPELLTRDDFGAIDVYFISDTTTKCHPKIATYDDPRINFIETRLPVCSNKAMAILRIVVFCWCGAGRLRRRPAEQHFVVAIGTFYEGAVLALLKVLKRRPPLLIAWIRGVWSKEIYHRHGALMQRIINTVERQFLSRADLILSNGNDTKAFYERLLDRHVEAIPNALDLEKYAAVSRRAFSSPSRTVSFIGRLSEEKGLRAYLQGIESYLTDHPADDLTFEIVGDGPLRGLVEAFAAKYGRWVRYLGPLSNENMLAYLETIDAGVCLTYSGNSGGGGVSNGLLELIGAGRLVIAWASPIFNQVLDDTQGFLVTEGDIAQLTQCFVALDPDDARLRIAHSKDVLPRYSLETHVEKFVGYLRAGLKNAGR